MNYIEVLENRRSVYLLAADLGISKEEVVEALEQVVENSPTAFNMQSSRIVVLFGAEHRRLWEITSDTLRAIVPAKQFSATEAKMQMFASGAGTILFFEDEGVVDEYKQKYAQYASAFGTFAAHGLGILQGNVWNVLAEKGIGANLQHYNPLIDDAVKAQWNIPQQWRLVSQMVFGSVVSRPDPVEKIPAAERVKVFGD